MKTLPLLLNYLWMNIPILEINYSKPHLGTKDKTADCRTFPIRVTALLTTSATLLLAR